MTDEREPVREPEGEGANVEEWRDGSSEAIRQTISDADEKLVEARGILKEANNQIARWDREKRLRSGGTYKP